MPMFEYHCTRCGHVFEELVFGDELPPCPSCHADATEKLISRPCRHRDSGGAPAGLGAMPSSSGGGGCSGCSGGNCASCH